MNFNFVIISSISLACFVLLIKNECGNLGFISEYYMYYKK